MAAGFDDDVLRRPMNFDPTSLAIWIVGGLSTVLTALLAYLYKLLRNDVSDLKGENTKIKEDAARLREEIPTKYAQLGSMERMFEKLDTKLDKLFDKLDMKQDKP